MKYTSFILIAVLLSASGAALSHERGHRCTVNGISRGDCPAPPAPPAPPSPPTMPAPPAPPAPPPMMDAPAAAHAACAGKAEGSAINWTTADNHKLAGTCEKDNRGMYFEVHSVRHTK